MTIRVNSIAGTLCSLHASKGADFPVTHLKLMVQRRTAIAPAKQRLFLEASPLYDNQSLHVLEEGVDITMIRRSDEAACWLTLIRKSRHGRALIAMAPEEVRCDPEMALAALKWDVADLKHMDKSLLEDRSFMLEAVSAKPEALALAAPSLKEDADVVLRAARKDPDSLRHAAPELQSSIWSDAEFVLAVVAKKPQTVMRRASEELLGSSDFVRRAVEKVPSIFEFVRDEQKDNRDIVLAAVSQNGRLLQFASGRLRSDPEVIRASTKHSKHPSTAGIRLQ
jgi:hypothetical protein